MLDGTKSRALRPILSPWYRHSTAYALHQIHDPFEQRGIARGCCVICDDLEKVMRNGGSVQSHLSKMLRPLDVTFSAKTLLKRRWMRWLSGVDLENAVAHALRAAQALRRVVPPCVVLHAILITWFNGWCTARRFQQTGLCCLCQDCNRPVEIEHYACCPRF